MMKTTNLDLSSIYFLSGSDRNISETLEPISEVTQLRRTVNGRLISIADTNFRKYRVSINCNDLRAPTLDGIWPGNEIEVSCLTEMSKRVVVTGPLVSFTGSDGIQKTGIKIDVEREPVSGSVSCRTSSNVAVSIIDVVGTGVYIENYVGELYITYRPKLHCIIENWSVDEDEANASVSWSLSALEI